MAKRYDPILCMMVEEKVNTKDGAYGTVLDYYNQMKGKSKSEVERILASAEGNPNAYLAYKKWKAKYDKAKDSNALDEAHNAADKDLPAFGVSYISGYAGGGVNRTEIEYFHTEHEANKKAAELKSKNIKGVSVKKYENFYHTKDANTLHETFAHGNSKHAGVLEMNGKVKVVVWNEGDNPRTGKVTVIGEDTPANRSKAKSMLDSASALDEAISTCDAVNIDIDHVANYLWTWQNGSDVARQLFHEGLDKYPGPHTPEHKDPAYKFAAEYALKELDNVYRKLKSEVDKKLKSGYEKSKQNLNDLKKG